MAKTYNDYEGELIVMSMEMTDTISQYPIDIPEKQYARFNVPIEIPRKGRIVGVGNGFNGRKRILHDIPENQLGGMAPFNPLELLGVIARLEDRANYVFVND